MQLLEWARSVICNCQQSDLIYQWSQMHNLPLHKNNFSIFMLPVLTICNQPNWNPTSNLSQKLKESWSLNSKTQPASKSQACPTWAPFNIRINRQTTPHSTSLCITARATPLRLMHRTKRPWPAINSRESSLKTIWSFSTSKRTQVGSSDALKNLAKSMKSWRNLRSMQRRISITWSTRKVRLLSNYTDHCSHKTCNRSIKELARTH